MSSLLNPRELFIRQSAVSLVLLSVLGGGVATLLHRQEAQAATLNLLVPPLMTVVYGALFVYLYWVPSRAMTVFWVGVLTGLAALVTPIIAFFVRAWSDPHLSLVDELPPIVPLLIPLVLCIMTFLPFRSALRFALICWLLVAAPMLVYLLLHPAQLQAPRGQEMVILLGPVMLLVLAYIPFQRGVEQHILALQAERERLQELAEKDALTGLHNRRAGEAFLRTLMLSSGCQLELAIFDVDHFKAVNDQHGHSVGDLVLREIAARCAARVRHGDLVARWGGEEFLLVHPVNPETPIGHTAEELRRVIAHEPIATVGVVTASFGVTRMQKTDSIASLLQRADEALYEAKRSGRNRVVVR